MRVEGSVCSVQCSVFRIQGPGFRVWGHEHAEPTVTIVCVWCGVWGLGFGVCGLWFVVCGSWCVVCGSWFVVWGVGFGVKE